MGVSRRMGGRDAGDGGGGVNLPLASPCPGGLSAQVKEVGNKVEGPTADEPHSLSSKAEEDWKGDSQYLKSTSI